jgi:hypothetical protein
VNEVAPFLARFFFSDIMSRQVKWQTGSFSEMANRELFDDNKPQSITKMNQDEMIFTDIHDPVA